MKLFKPGDWVIWNYRPRDPNGPYEYLIKPNKLWGIHDTIDSYLMEYETPPYRVELVISYKTVAHSANVSPVVTLADMGCSQIVGIWMTRKANHGEIRTDIQKFSGKLFKKVPSQLAFWLSLEYRRLGDKLHLEYRP